MLILKEQVPLVNPEELALLCQLFAGCMTPWLADEVTIHIRENHPRSRPGEFAVCRPDRALTQHEALELRRVRHLYYTTHLLFHECEDVTNSIRSSMQPMEERVCRAVNARGNLCCMSEYGWDPVLTHTELVQLGLDHHVFSKPYTERLNPANYTTI